jgi:ankyrin repeat protein
MNWHIYTFITDYRNKKITLETLSNYIKQIVGLDLTEIKKDLSPIMWACKYNIPEVALLLIQSGKSNPEYVNKKGETALLYSLYEGLPDVALALIQTGKSRPEQVNVLGDTALIWACAISSSEVALALIQTGNSIPDQVNSNGNTALIYACKNNMTEIAIALIQTGDSMPEQVNLSGESALIIAKEKGLTEVVKLLNETINTMFNIINLNATGFDQTAQESYKISSFLSESRDNICIKLNNSYFLTSKIVIKNTMADKVNIKYECKQAGDNVSIYTKDSNIIYDTKYVSLSSIIGLQALVNYNEMEKIVNDKTSSTLFYITRTRKKLPSIISQMYIDGGEGMSADHCGTGKERYVYNIYAAQPMCGEVEELNSSESQTSDAATSQNKLKIQYKGVAFPFPVTETDTIGEIKKLLLEKLMSENLIASINQNVKFIYKGKIYTDDSILLSSLENNPFDITLQSLVSPKTGGRKTRKPRKIYKRKTRKLYGRKKVNLQRITKKDNN